MNLTFVLLCLPAVAVFGWLAWRTRQNRAETAEAEAELEAYEPEDRFDIVLNPDAGRDRLKPVPRALEQPESLCWVRAGEAVEVGTVRLERGLIYVGAGLYKDRNAWLPYDFLIDPTLPVNTEAPDLDGRTVAPWASYNKLTPNARAAFLLWLADGAQSPDAVQGFVMMYAQGLRHRLNQTPPADEAAAIREEMTRLRMAYPHHTLAGTFLAAPAT
ncbi:MAG: TerB N-terminal domain-containing protein [Bacteroidota bacterium]